MNLNNLIMKVSHLLLFILSLGYISGVNAQNWFPVGAQWHYDRQSGIGPLHDYFRLSVEKDTIINGKACQKIIKDDGLECLKHDSVEFVYEQNDSVFIFLLEFDEFRLYYNLTMAVGDTLFLELMDLSTPPDLDTILTVLDSVSTVQINGASYQKQHLTFKYLGEYSQYTQSLSMLERIGMEPYFFYHHREEPSFSCDGDFITGLRCYEDALVGFYETGLADSCTYKLDLSPTVLDSRQLKVYPNPAYDVLNISSSLGYAHFNYTLTSISGELILEGRAHSLDVSGLPRGLYILTVTDQSAVMGRQKIVLR